MAISPQFQTNARKLLEAIRRLKSSVESGAFREILAQAGDETLAWVQREYKGKARMDWLRLSMPAVVLSRQRLSRPIESWAQLKSAMRRAQPLIDTGQTLRSFTRGDGFNVFRLENDAVTVGSAAPHIAAHQKDRRTTFTFGPEQRALFERNVPKRVVSFARFIKELRGERVRGRARENPVHEPLKRVLEKMDGQSFKVPARALPRQVPAAIINRLRRNAARIMRDRWRAGV